MHWQSRLDLLLSFLVTFHLTLMPDSCQPRPHGWHTDQNLVFSKRGLITGATETALQIPAQVFVGFLCEYQTPFLMQS